MVDSNHRLNAPNVVLNQAQLSSVFWRPVTDLNRRLKGWKLLLYLAELTGLVWWNWLVTIQRPWCFKPLLIHLSYSSIVLFVWFYAVTLLHAIWLSWLGFHQLIL